MNHDYAPPVDKLLEYGDAHGVDWPDYLALGIRAEHIPELVRMVSDEALQQTDSESSSRWAAPIHAWRALGQLRAEAAVEPLLQQIIVRNSDEYGYDDWSGEELPDVFGMIGSPAIPALKNYMQANAQIDNHYPGIAASGLRHIAEAHPELRDECIAAIRDQLAKFEENPPILNAELILELRNLKVTDLDSLTPMKAAYFAKRVDLTFAGNWSDIKADLNLDPALEIPGGEPEDMPIPSLLPEGFIEALDKYRALTERSEADDQPEILHKTLRSPQFPPRPNTKKIKAKRKQEKKSRKQNRKR